MKKKYYFYIIFSIIVVILFFRIRISLLEYDNYFLQGFLDESMIESMKNCFTLRDSESIECYRVNQKRIFEKLKKEFNLNYMSIRHARWSDKGSNFDAQNYHRDIKVNFLKHRGEYPKVYTFVCFLDKAKHMQGGVEYLVEPGDCLLFNAFNLHKGSNLNFDERRRVIQFFHIFFDKEEEEKFHNKHSYAEHYDNDLFLKNVNKYIDTRYIAEMLNMVIHLFPMKLYDSEKNTYVTLINKSKLIAVIDGIEYYEKF